MSIIENNSHSMQNNAVLEQAAAVRKSMTTGTETTENKDTTKKVDSGENVTGSKQESVKVEISVNVNSNSKSTEFIDNLKSAVNDISSNQSASKQNEEQLRVLNEIKDSLKQNQISGLFGTSSTVNSFGDIADKLSKLNEDSSSSDSSDGSSSTVDKLGLSDLAKALSKDGSGITADNIDDFIKDVESAINTVSKDKEENDNAVLTQNERVLEESKKLRESMTKNTDMAEESKNFSAANVTSQAGSLAQAQGGNAKGANSNVISDK